MEGIDLVEVNKIRTAMGMKPIPVPGQTNNPPNLNLVFEDGNTDRENGTQDTEKQNSLEARQAAANENWLKLNAEKEARESRQLQKESLRRRQNLEARSARLQGKSLGHLSSDEELEDVRTWALKSNKRRKKIEKDRQTRMEQELKEQQEKKSDCTATDLKGLKVGHRIDEFMEGEEKLLTLKDITVGGEESEEDELEAVELREKERREERLVASKRKLVYDPTLEDEDPNNPTTGFLSHYDEVINGKKTFHFTLDDLHLQMTPPPQAKTVQEEVPRELRKHKKKRERLGRDRAAELLKTLKEASETEAADNQKQEVGLVIDETTEFVSALRTTKASNSSRRHAFTGAKSEQHPESSLPDGSRPGDPADHQLANGCGSVELKRPRQDSSTGAVLSPGYPIKSQSRSQSRSRSRSRSLLPDGSVKSPDKHEEGVPAGEGTLGGADLGEEQDINEGIGATLNMLKSRGLIKPSEAGMRNQLYREKMQFKAEKVRREADAERRARQQRERDRASGKLDRMTAREREEYARQVNLAREQSESRMMAEIFNRDYKPNISLSYTDEFGRHMTPKETFKHLSHMFHGKGSGNKKTEKRLKAIEDEKKREARSLLDNSRNTGAMGNVAQNRAKTNRQAGVRLQ